MVGQLQVELVLRTSNKEELPEWFRKLFEHESIFESGGRLIIDISGNWKGFKDGTIIKILEHFNESIYIALAYITEDDKELVTDLEGNPVDRFDVVIEGKKCFKYVKKRLRILDVMKEEDEIFMVQGFVLNLKYTEPIMKILDVYSVGREGGLRLSNFIKG